MRALIVLALLSSTARADDEETIREPPPKTPFDRGRINFGLAGGSTSNFGQRYFGIGAGFGYFVLDGVELGISGLYQFGDGPDISKVAPSLRYVAQPLVGKWPVIPYVGTFYTHWFIGDGLADVDAVGGRLGFLYVSGHLLLGLGVAVEKTVSECVMDCTTAYPDLTISLAF